MKSVFKFDYDVFLEAISKIDGGCNHCQVNFLINLKDLIFAETIFEDLQEKYGELDKHDLKRILTDFGCLKNE